jgi:peptidoglycan/xylan/chitin deacetylase (PgdA/CDA1 family)
MYKSTFLLWLVAFSCLSLTSLNSQTASFANWKDNKKAAYTIVHDDFGDYVTGIYDYAYPIATARGIRFSFGAITGNCGATEWTKARTMIANGHECINHSHSHRCGGAASDCTGVLSYGQSGFGLELDTSTKLIERNTGVRPLFFIHPYDAHTQTVLNYLKNNLGYIGSRAGTGALNTTNFTNYMNLNFYGFDNSANAIASLKTTVDEAIAANAYLMREFHGVDDPSYGAITSANYTAHLDYVKTQSDNGLLWAAPVSEVITYKMQRDAYTIATAYTASTGTLNVNFTNTKTLNTAVLRTPVTVNVNLGTIVGTFTATQGGKSVPVSQNGNIISFNVYPYQGNVVLTTAVVAQPNNVSGLTAKAQSASALLSWTNPSSNFDEVMIVAKATTAFTTRPSGTTYTADANFQGAGTAFEGGKVVYRGKAASVNVTGLTNGTLYHFKAFSRFGSTWSSGVAVNATPFASAFDATLCYRLTARHSGKVMGLASNSTADNVALVQNPWINNVNQVFRIKPVDATYYQLFNGFSGKVVTVQNASTANAAAIVQATNQVATHQQFQFRLNTEGYYNLVAKHSSRAIDVYGGLTDDNTALIQWRDSGDPNQQWTVAAVACPVGTAALASGRVVAFNCFVDNHKGVLQWVVNSNDLKDYYEVQKEDDNKEFKALTDINGNSSEALRSFTFSDATLADGDNVYRLKSVNTNGSFELSDPITLNYQQPNLYALYPNPTIDYVEVNLTTCENKPVVLTVVDASGHVVKTLSLDRANKNERVDVENFAAGQYLLHIKAEGKRPATRVFIVLK